LSDIVSYLSFSLMAVLCHHWNVLLSECHTHMSLLIPVYKVL